MSEPTQPVKRRYSYAPMLLVMDVIDLLAERGVVVEMSGAEKIREPVKAARKMLKALHVSPHMKFKHQIEVLREKHRN